VYSTRVVSDTLKPVASFLRRSGAGAQRAGDGRGAPCQLHTELAGHAGTEILPDTSALIVISESP
jgi:hypothetical protein